MGDKLKVYLESSFISYLTGGSTANAKIAAEAGYVCPQVMTPKTFLDNLNMEAENA